MQQYLDLAQDVLANGDWIMDRTGTGTVSVLNRMLKFDLQKGFPAVTTKHLFFRGVVAELLWFLSGSTNMYDLEERTYGTRGERGTIWTGNYEKQGKEKGYEDGYLGPIYGKQWRSFIQVDQITKLIKDIKNDTFHNRKMIVSAWNPLDLPDMVLSPCHLMFVVNTRKNKLNLTWYQPSCDVFLGLPYNIASYATLAHILAQICGLDVGELCVHLGDTHIYQNHIDQITEQLTREPKDLPELILPEFSTLEEVLALDAKDFILKDYNPHGKLVGKMSA
ncbi:putative thymidylate synthase [Pectobacterium phage DU_PP_V]|uniref:thymidylate synthase n=1 Tax=Pectobacterium phage DU_PP_V TaxID=2041492 RepID=A0A2D2W6Y0_9CAUD|nr:thymidylate synthase [Pectobacterium phage DU_PP_V]ATS94056.1 putative thymidylate synthase [Pectobacterium phage DU_PP_V]